MLSPTRDIGLLDGAAIISDCVDVKTMICCLTWDDVGQ